MADEIKDDSLSMSLPNSTSLWLKSAVKGLEREIRELKRDKEHLFEQLGKCQGDYQDLYDLVQSIAENRELHVVTACREMIQRFNPGSYEQEDK